MGEGDDPPLERSGSCRPSSPFLVDRPVLAWPKSASSEVPIDSMPMPCLPDAAPTGEREQATAISMAGCE
jgi:hypothetical protein